MQVKLYRHAERRAFTLIELLVVICIIALLASLSMGALQKAIVYSKRSACSNNLRQIGAGLMAFASDHDGALPECGGTIMHGNVDPNTGLPGWTEQIESYMGQTQSVPGSGSSATEASLKVYRCPDSSGVFASNKTYSYFQGAHAAMVANGGFSAVRLALITSPSITIMGGDIASGGLFSADDADKDDYTQNPAFPGGTIPIHGGYSNILFYDGHVTACNAYDRQTMAVRYTGPDVNGLDNIYH